MRESRTVRESRSIIDFGRVRYGATVVIQHPARFGLMASLPMDDVEAALCEIRFAFDTLGADGVVMVTNYGGSYLGDAKFEPVFAEMNRRSATIFIHPA